MRVMFADRLIEAHSKTKNHFCIGIDPHLEKVSGTFFLRQLRTVGPAEFMLAMGRQLISVAADAGVASVKLQSAFFEVAGEGGWRVLKQLISEAKAKNLLTILDVKRGDISSTMQAYGKACFDELGADAITILPYMGISTVAALQPWLQQGKGAYVVWVSSNSDSEWLQAPIASQMLDRLQEWLGQSDLTGSCGLVLGATKVEDLSEELFSRSTGYPLLLPGLGAQGALPGPRMKRLIRECPSHVIPVSRGISLFGLEGAEGDLERCESWDDYIVACAERFEDLRVEIGPSMNG